MARLCFSLCLLIAGTMAVLSPLRAAGGKTTISILSPHNGETVAETFDLTYEISNGPKGHHAHVYLDGAYQKGFKGTFSGVPKGEHTITVKIADHDHKETGHATDTITIKVAAE